MQTLHPLQRQDLWATLHFPEFWPGHLNQKIKSFTFFLYASKIDPNVRKIIIMSHIVFLPTPTKIGLHNLKKGKGYRLETVYV